MPIDYSKYPPNWKTEIRPFILKRAQNQCEFCLVPNYSLIYRNGKGLSDWELWPEGMASEVHELDGYKAIKVVLTIMHLDHDVTNNCWSNLAAGCQRCHNKWDAPYRAQNAKATRLKKSGQSQIIFKHQ